MIVRILRRESKDSKPYIQDFEYKNASSKVTVAKILSELNSLDDLFDVNGNPARRIRWECSCMQKMCGGCAMVINGIPALACSTFIDIEKTKVLTLAPLTKFPAISDLIVDRTIILQHQIDAQLYLGNRKENAAKEFGQQYSVSKCLKCGLCLEVCPNYSLKQNEFYGASFANDSYLLTSMSEDREKELVKQYKKHFEKYCSKVLSCRSICPMKIQTLSSIGFMNKK